MNKKIINNYSIDYYSAGMTLTNFPKRPRSSKRTIPLLRAKRVSSLPRPTFLPGFIFFPLCLTMIEPHFTDCPPKRLIPRRFERLSLPFRELPVAFL